MIQLSNISKKFGEIQAVEGISLMIPDGSVFGLLGSNGAGKSTLLRMMAGILKEDAGEILVDGDAVFDNPEIKQNLFYLSDAPYYFSNATLQTMKEFYQNLYPQFDQDGFEMLIRQFNLNENKRIRTFSKGMKRQAFIILAICSNTKYILCDEVFDGLDPIVSKVVKDLFRQERKMRKMTLVMASHDLKELEDFCDSIGIIHKGDLLHSSEIRKETSDMHKIQCVFEQDEEAFLREHLHIVRYARTGNFVTMVVKGEKEAIMQKIQEKTPVWCETIPLSIEEIFLCNMEGVDYDISKVIF